MRFFLDKNIPMSLLVLLKEKNYAVEHARITFPTETSDEKIATYANKNSAILVTKDLEFGSKLLYPKRSHYGLVIIRLPYYFNAKQITYSFEELLKSINPEQLKGSISILELGRYRIRKL